MYRRQLRHSRVKNLYKFASFKTGCMHTVEFSFEFDTCFHLEYSPKVKYFCAQPLGFTYLIDGKTNPYTPDFKTLSHNQKTTFIEVKPHSETLHSDFVKKFHAKKEAAYQLGCDLILVTDVQIRKPPTLNNYKLLHRYAGFHTHDEMHNNVYNVVQKFCPIYLQAVLEFFDDDCYSSVLTSILSLVASGGLKANIREQNIDNNLLLWV